MPVNASINLLKSTLDNASGRALAVSSPHLEISLLISSRYKNRESNAPASTETFIPLNKSEKEPDILAAIGSSSVPMDTINVFAVLASI